MGASFRGIRSVPYPLMTSTLSLCLNECTQSHLGVRKPQPRHARGVWGGGQLARPRASRRPGTRVFHVLGSE